jgi:hypothetical protein
MAYGEIENVIHEEMKATAMKRRGLWSGEAAAEENRRRRRIEEK